MLSSILSQFGYSERESRIYLALLELGPAPASTVARYVGDNRVTVYSVLKLLVKDGIVSESKNGSTQYYFGMDPVRLVERERERYERLQSALPELLSLINVRSHRPKVRFYEWIEGLRRLFDDTMPHLAWPLHGFLGAKHMDPVFETYLRRTLEVERRKPPEVPTHVIIVGESDHWYARYCREHYHTKTVPMPAFPMEHEIFAYQDQVIILMYHTSELSGIVIESRSLADGIRSMFDLVWSYAPDLHGGSARV